MASIDVVIPNYQYARFLAQCVDSVLQQRIDDLRILIIDNASTDNSLQVAHELARRDPRIEVRAHQTNLGFHASINEGLDWAAGDYLMVLCADDLLPPGALTRAASILDANPDVAFAYGAYLQMRGHDLPVDTGNAGQMDWSIEAGSAFIARCCDKMVHTMAPLVRTAVQKRVGHYRRELAQTSDLEILLRLACLGDVAATSAIQGIQRIHEQNISASSWQSPALSALHELSTFDSFFRHEGKSLPSAAKAYRRAKRNIAQRCYWRGFDRIVRGRPGDGMKLLGLALRLAPEAVIIPPMRQLLRMKLSRSQTPVRRVAPIPVRRRSKDHAAFG